ncbi:hypothetical protein PM8797T_22123 [Gimesia maris DSM 8797]|nr:hypothetical protein PM8797T_22123 [Gimesia maris DSM 8797]
MKLEEMFELFREFQQLFLRVSTGVQRILKATQNATPSREESYVKVHWRWHET